VAQGIVNRVVPSSAFALGVARLVVSSTFLISIIFTSFSALGSLPVTILRPTGVMKLLPWNLYDQLLTQSSMVWLKTAMILSLLFSAAGLLTTISTKTSLLLVLFYQGLLRSFGHFNHDEMLAVYCLVVLAFTPCGDVFSIDSWLKRRWGGHGGPPLQNVHQAGNSRGSFVGVALRGHPRFAYAYPILLMQLLVAWTYFSSALIKLRIAGLKYLSPDNLPALAIFHSLDNLHDTSFRLAFRLPEFKAYLPFVVGFILLWELLFPLAVFRRRLRSWILGIGIVFHLSTLFLMNIFFPHHLAMYLIFVNWDRFFGRQTFDTVSAPASEKA
jgi:hypothetical protein